ncbi:MAG: hypothetical protein CBE24_00030 [bacterium TMED264]|nr:MAG: hypothetical protein CBE24_00030 [bacterium TMED264]
MRLGLEFGGTNFKLGLMKENGYVMKLELIQAKKLFQSNNIIKEIKNKIDLFLNGKVISCGGISSKGIVDVTKGMVLDDVGEAKILSNIPLREILSSAYDVPFNIDNDARCYALGESKFGGWSKYKNMTCVTLGTGIGCASILNGNLFYGSDNLGGILGGHISINKNGPKCSCGNIGCLELYCSKIGLIRLLKNSKSEHLSKKDPVKSFFTSLNENGSSNNKIFKDFINNLSIGLTNIINAYSPDIIVLGGGIMKSNKIIIPKIRKIIKEMAFTVPKGRCQIFSSKLGDKAPLLGAAFHPKLEI